MSSLLTSVSAMSALRMLNATQKTLTGVEHQISTGLRVADASDDAAYWSIGVGMRSRLGAVSAVQDSLALTQSIADVTAAALKGIIGTVQSIQADVVTASEPGVDRQAIQQSIAAKQRSVLSAAQSASFNGVNWLTLNTPYIVTDHLVSTEAHTASSSDAAKISGNQVATTNLSDSVQYDDVDTIVVTGPNGFSNTIVSQSDQTSISTKALGASSSQTVSSPLTLTVNPGTPLEAARMDAGPASYTDAGLTSLNTGDLSIYNVGYNLQSTWDYTQTYSGSSSHWQDTSNSQRYFFSAATNAAFAASIPGSLLSPLLGLDVSNPTSLASGLGVISETLTGLIAKTAAVGSLQTRLSAQKSFNAALSDALTSGIGSLVDADMNMASTRLQALQTQQQLGIQALSIANDNGKQILKLFG